MSERNKHSCELSAPCDGYGPAITEVFEDDDGILWAGNGEYYSQVNYCPVCGYKTIRAISTDIRGNVAKP